MGVAFTLTHREIRVNEVAAKRADEYLTLGETSDQVEASYGRRWLLSRTEAVEVIRRFRKRGISEFSSPGVRIWKSRTGSAKHCYRLSMKIERFQTPDLR